MSKSVGSADAGFSVGVGNGIEDGFFTDARIVFAEVSPSSILGFGFDGELYLNDGLFVEVLVEVGF